MFHFAAFCAAILLINSCNEPLSVDNKPTKSPVVINEGNVELYDQEFGLYYGDRDRESKGVYYLVLSDEKREEVRQKAPKSLTETFAVVDSCIQKRAVDVELYRIGREKYPSDEHFPVLWSINQKENDVMHKIVQAFTYGMMCGKRAERVKKRRNN